MFKLLFILCLSLCLPLSALAENETSKQTDKTPKDSAVLSDNKHGSKQGKPAATPLDEQRFEFVRTNLISTFYHELAHALIDTMELPILGKEEDAADVFSVVMIERLFDEADVLAISGGSARGFELDAIEMRRKGREWDWTDDHSPDMQRYYNIVCLTYGAAPKQREAFASKMKLTDDRAEYCHEEFDLANNSWDPIIRQIETEKAGEAVNFRQSARTALQIRGAEVIAAEVKTVNDKFNLPKRLRVMVKRCSRDSDFYAFYSPSRKKITVCTNYIDELYRDAPK